MNKNILACATFVGATLMAAVLPAQAAPITFTLQDLSFTDGATGSGYFTYDADTGAGYDFSISTTDGVLPAFTFDAMNSRFYAGFGFGPNNLIITTGDRYINFSFLEALSRPGVYAINTASSWECNNCGIYRYVASGSVSSLIAEVPEPATALLMLPALGFLAVRRRSR